MSNGILPNNVMQNGNLGNGSNGKHSSTGKINGSIVTGTVTRVKEDPLCCCEYVNQKGDRSHILSCLCECDAVDELADRCITCRPISSELYDKIGSVLNDRLRMPWCYGGGALRLRADKFLPVVFVPFTIFVGTLHPIATVISMIGTPFLVLLLYRIWIRPQDRMHTTFFFNWTIISLTMCYFVLMVPVNILHKLLLWENMISNTLFLLMVYALIRIHRDPGIVYKPRTGSLIGKGGYHRKSKSFTSGEFAEMTAEESRYSRNGYPRNVYQSGKASEYYTNNGPADASSPTKSSSESTNVGVRPWCSVCNLEQAPRSSHCPLCNLCIHLRDHHCVWIDCCVGASNHRLFFFSILLFLVTTAYCSLLALTTVCTPNMYADWFLLPVDCRFVYQDTMTAWIFVTCVYSLLCAVPIFIMWLLQVVLISQNVTSQELHRARQERRTRFWVFVPSHPYNCGFFRNWIDFLAARRLTSVSQPTSQPQPGKASISNRIPPIRERTESVAAQT